MFFIFRSRALLGMGAKAVFPEGRQPGVGENKKRIHAVFKDPNS